MHEPYRAASPHLSVHVCVNNSIGFIRQKQADTVVRVRVISLFCELHLITLIKNPSDLSDLREAGSSCGWAFCSGPVHKNYK